MQQAVAEARTEHQTAVDEAQSTHDAEAESAETSFKEGSEEANSEYDSEINRLRSEADVKVQAAQGAYETAVAEARASSDAIVASLKANAEKELQDATNDYNSKAANRKSEYQEVTQKIVDAFDKFQETAHSEAQSEFNGLKEDAKEAKRLRVALYNAAVTKAQAGAAEQSAKEEGRLQKAIGVINGDYESEISGINTDATELYNSYYDSLFGEDTDWCEDPSLSSGSYNGSTPWGYGDIFSDFVDELVDSFSDGSAFDSASGVLVQEANWVVGNATFGLAPPIEAGPLFGNEEAYANGVIVGNLTTTAMDAVSIAAAAKKLAATAAKEAREMAARRAAKQAQQQADDIAKRALPIADEGPNFSRNGGCFTADTLVHVPEVSSPQWFSPETTYVDSDRSWESLQAMPLLGRSTATQSIASIRLGQRVMGENPEPWEVDRRFEEPIAETWIQLTAKVVRDDGSLVQIELLRPEAWVIANDVHVGQQTPMAIAELGVRGAVKVTALDPCPPIDTGEGHVVTGRYVTQRVDNLIQIRLDDGSQIDSTAVHPFWSHTRRNWVPAGELLVGERLEGEVHPIAVTSVEQKGYHEEVYNLEIHGEHVYRVAGPSILVHNGNPVDCVNESGYPKSPRGRGATPPSDRDPKRVWTKKENEAKLTKQDGKCAACDERIDTDNGRGHHRERHADGGKTDDANHDVLCIECHKETHRP